MLQIVATRQKHVFRCAPRGAAAPARDDGAARVDDEGDADFDDATSARLTLAAGLFCGACARRVSALLPIPDGGRAVPKACPGCGAGVRRFAMS